MRMTDKEQIDLQAQFQKFMVRETSSGNIRGWHICDFSDKGVWLCYRDNGYLAWRDNKLRIVLVDANFEIPARKMRWEACMALAQLPIDVRYLYGNCYRVTTPWGERQLSSGWYAMTDLLNPFWALTA